jgi:serine/threonine-protein kinase
MVASEDRFEEAVWAYLQARESGQRADTQEWLARYPEVAAELASFFAAQEELDRLAAPLRVPPSDTKDSSTADQERTDQGTGSTGPDSFPRTLGDYELLGELGHGGMGTVYQARQRSLNRLVAVKVIRAGELANSEDVRRFRNEAEMAALLDHPQIVPIHEVREVGGQLYFSMRLLEGGSLAEHLDRFTADPRAAAKLVAEVARAVHHAHQRGILHRDLKPANILLDAAGRPHVGDFGLARRLAVDSSLTQSGAIVGSPSYMAPEQAGGRRAEVTTAADVYGLGAVLYALLTGGPPFRGETVLETLEQVRFQPPASPRARNPRVDRDLETICLKCLEKEPARRYGTADALADDLERWLEDRPIEARRAGGPERLWRWGRRHRLAVGAAACLVLMLAGLTASAGWVLGDRAARREETERVIDGALAEVESLRQVRKYPEALAAARRTEALLAEGEGHDKLRRRVREVVADLEMVARLEDIRLRTLSTVIDGSFDRAGADRNYAQAFRDYGIDVDALPPAEAGRQLQTLAIRVELAAALDDWAVARMEVGQKGDGKWKDLLALARAADGDDLRCRLREALGRMDRKALEQLASASRVEDLPVPTAVVLGLALRATGAVPRAMAVLRAAQRLHPEDFWINFVLANTCQDIRPPDLDGMIRFYTAALAIRPGHPPTLNNLGNALKDRGQLDEAISAYRTGIEFDPRYALGRLSLGNALKARGDLDGAIREYRTAIEFNPKYAPAYSNLGNTMRVRGQPDEAIHAHTKALELDPKNAQYHSNLGNALRDKALRDKSQLDEAVREYRTAIELDAKLAGAHSNLAITLKARGQWDEAFREYRTAIELDPKIPQPHGGLGRTLLQLGRFAEARVAIRRCLELLPPGDPLRREVTPDLRRCEELLALEDKLSAILEGKEKPAGAAQRLALARFCQQPFKKLYAASARLFAEAFAHDARLSDDLHTHDRYNAACAAVLAGCGEGKDADTLDAKGRTRLRHQALDWLRADLTTYRQELDESAAKAGSAIAQRMQLWLQDKDFARVRGPEALARLPEAEREDWQKLWQEVEALRHRAAQPPGASRPGRPRTKADREKRSKADGESSPPCRRITTPCRVVANSDVPMVI